MSAPPTVTGGTGGIEAQTEDLRLAARLIARLGDEVRAALSDGLLNTWLFGPWDQFTPFGAEVTAAHHRILAAGSPGPTAIATCDELRRKLLAAAADYEQADGSTADTLLRFGLVPAPAMFAAARSLFGALLQLAGSHDLARAAEEAATSDPALVDAAMLGSGALPLDVVLSRIYPDGSPVVTDTGVDPSSAAPRTVADLIVRLAARDAASDTGGAIDVTVITGPDRRRRAIVDIPGTKTWDPGESRDVTSLATNARAVLGAPTSYAAGVLLAMQRAGVRADEPVLLVGHSQGGMVAVEVAAIARRSRLFDVTHVVTAGAPIGHTVGALPPTVDVLALENSTDVVPHLDAMANPDRRNVTTVTFRAGDGTIRGDHALDPDYEYGARLVDAGSAVSLRDFEDSASGFLTGGTPITYTYTVSRRL